jgi:hypothetical protein
MKSQIMAGLKDEGKEGNSGSAGDITKRQMLPLKKERTLLP